MEVLKIHLCVPLFPWMTACKVWYIPLGSVIWSCLPSFQLPGPQYSVLILRWARMGKKQYTVCILYITRRTFTIKDRDLQLQSPSPLSCVVRKNSSTRWLLHSARARGCLTQRLLLTCGGIFLPCFLLCPALPIHRSSFHGFCQLHAMCPYVPIERS